MSETSPGGSRQKRDHSCLIGLYTERLQWSKHASSTLQTLKHICIDMNLNADCSGLQRWWPDCWKATGVSTFLQLHQRRSSRQKVIWRDGFQDTETPAIHAGSDSAGPRYPPSVHERSGIVEKLKSQ
jgi:hypothetical protein